MSFSNFRIDSRTPSPNNERELSASVPPGMDMGANPSEALLYYVKEGNLAVVKGKLEKDHSLIGTQDSAGNSIFHLACLSGNVDLVEFLFQTNPAFLHAKNLAGKTAQDLVKSKKNLYKVDNFLISCQLPNKFNPVDDAKFLEQVALRKTNKLGQNALLRAAQEKDPDAMWIAFGKAHDLADWKDSLGRNLLSVAMDSHHPETIETAKEIALLRHKEIQLLKKLNLLSSQLLD